MVGCQVAAQCCGKRAAVSTPRAALRRALLAWFRKNRRDLPWRRTRDPYAIWVAETMLQQTRVQTVIPYYERFMARFPSVQMLADAPAEELMLHWAGLGYYSRARNLQAAACQVVNRHGGALPNTARELRALPGIGRYTAGAVASIAFDRREPVVDGNVARLLARLFALREDIRAPAAQKRLWSEAARLASGAQPGALNEALMELGATICRPRAPRCGDCPLRRYCAAHAAGCQATLPVKSRPAPRSKVEAVAALLLRGGRVLAVRRPPGGLLGGLWELPGGARRRGEPLQAALARNVREGLGLRIHSAEPLGAVRHEFTHRHLRLHLFRAQAAPGRVRRAGFDGHRWCAKRAAAELPLSAVARKALALALHPAS